MLKKNDKYTINYSFSIDWTVTNPSLCHINQLNSRGEKIIIITCPICSRWSGFSVTTHLAECAGSRLSAPPRCLPGSTSSACTWAASWRWAVSPSTGEGTPASSTCTCRRASPGAAGSHRRRRPRSRRPAWSGPPCRCSCTRPLKRSCCVRGGCSNGVRQRGSSWSQ